MKGGLAISTKYAYTKQPDLSIKSTDGTVYAYRVSGQKNGFPYSFLRICQRLLTTGPSVSLRVLPGSIGSLQLGIKDRRLKNF